MHNFVKYSSSIIMMTKLTISGEDHVGNMIFPTNMKMIRILIIFIFVGKIMLPT